VGIVAFRLEADPDAAWGQAWITSRQWGYPDIALPRDLPSSNLVPTLSIRFTRAVGVLIQGRIEVRADPEMEWPIVMTFTGRAQGDVMQGTFIEDDPSTGTWIAGVWKVERTRFSAPKAAETASSSAHPFEDPLPTPRYADH
jgi:hypothetical protein